MTLIIALICIAIEQFTHQLNQIRSFAWLKSYLTWFRNTFPTLEGNLTLVLALTPIIAITILIFASVNTLLWVILAIVTLCYSIGPKNSRLEVTDYCDAVERDDPEAAYLYANRLKPTNDTLKTTEQLNQHVINATLSVSNDRIMAVLFWFLILGPVGALLYRCSSHISLLSREEDLLPLQESAQRLHYILEWVPARVTAFSYALAGSMNDAVANWRDYSCEWSQCFCNHNCGILVCSGLGALQIPADSQFNDLESVQAALSLTNRALIIWVSFIALLTLAGFA